MRSITPCAWPKRKSPPATAWRFAATPAYSINCIRSWAPGWEKKGWKKSGGQIKNLEIIQDCYAIFLRIKKELNLTHVAAHVGTEGNELADRMAMLGSAASRKRTASLSGRNGYSDAAESAGWLIDR